MVKWPSKIIIFQIDEKSDTSGFFFFFMHKNLQFYSSNV